MTWKEVLTLPKAPSPLLRYAPLLLLALLLALLYPRLADRMAGLASLRDEVSRLEVEVSRLRGEVSQIPLLQAKLADLEAQFRSGRWPKDPRREGLSWLEENLRQRGWSLESLEVAEAEPLAGGVRAVGVNVRGRAPDYFRLMEGLEYIAQSRIAIPVLKVSKEEEGLAVTLELKVPLVEVSQ